MSAPVLFARARESAAVLARAETLLRTPAGVVDVVVEASLPESDERAVLEPSLFFARACQSRQRLAKYDPNQPRDDEGKFAETPGLGVDKLKLAKRIQLGEGETLLSSRKFKTSDEGDRTLLAAEVDTPGGREIRLGLVSPDESRHWSAATREGVRKRLDELDTLLEDLDADDDRFDELDAERDSLRGSIDGTNTSVTLTPDAVAAMHFEISGGVATANEWADSYWDDNADVFDQIDAIYGPHRDRPSQLTAEELARVDELTAQTGAPDPDLMQGSVPVGGGASLSYQIVGDGEQEPATWRLEMAIRPADADESWYVGFFADAARFEPKDVKGLLDGLAELAKGSPLAPANRARLPRAEFTESKVKRDRKGRFAEKTAGQVLSELDELMGKLAGLQKHLSDDERDDFDEAMGYLAGVRETRKAAVDSGGRDSVEVEDAQYGGITLSVAKGGERDEIAVEYGDEGIYFTPDEAEEIAAFLDEFIDIGEDGDDEVAASRTTSSGAVTVVLFGNGMVEIGPSDETPGPEDGNTNLLIDPYGDFEDARALADALEELAETASQGPVTNTAVVLPWNHPGGPGHVQKDHGRRKKKLDLPDAPEVDKPAEPKAEPASKPKKTPAKRAPRKKAPPTQAEVDEAKLKLERAEEMHGTDRSKWSKRDRDAAEKLDRLIAEGTAAKTGKTRGAKDMFPPEGQEADRAHNDEVDAEMARLLEGEYAGGLRVTDVNGYHIGGGPGAPPSMPRGHMEFGGTIKDADGKSVGYFRRQIMYTVEPGEERGHWKAYHDRLFLDENVQGAGFARELNGKLYDWYRKSGLEYVDTNPGGTVGGYAWPSQGFDFDSRQTMEAFFLDGQGMADISRAPGFTRELKESQQPLLDALAGRVEAGEWVSAYELSQLGRQPGQGKDDWWIGKAALLGVGNGFPVRLTL